jgi:hypothetical protein
MWEVFDDQKYLKKYRETIFLEQTPLQKNYRA